MAKKKARKKQTKSRYSPKPARRTRKAIMAAGWRTSSSGSGPAGPALTRKRKK